mmetsp:Transcript_51836/g.143514  ORF Transcript_51836/g.143514 Transcript_51836/m.143514 type:complete len:208 (+) Transcript_51836:404-1027(+)
MHAQHVRYAEHLAQDSRGEPAGRPITVWVLQCSCDLRKRSRNCDWELHPKALRIRQFLQGLGPLHAAPQAGRLHNGSWRVPAAQALAPCATLGQARGLARGAAPAARTSEGVHRAAAHEAVAPQGHSLLQPPAAEGEAQGQAQGALQALVGDESACEMGYILVEVHIHGDALAMQVLDEQLVHSCLLQFGPGPTHEPALRSFSAPPR